MLSWQAFVIEKMGYFEYNHINRLFHEMSIIHIDPENKSIKVLLVIFLCIFYYAFSRIFTRAYNWR